MILLVKTKMSCVTSIKWLGVGKWQQHPDLSSISWCHLKIVNQCWWKSEVGWEPGGGGGKGRKWGTSVISTIKINSKSLKPKHRDVNNRILFKVNHGLICDKSEIQNNIFIHIRNFNWFLIIFTLVTIRLVCPHGPQILLFFKLAKLR